MIKLGLWLKFSESVRLWYVSEYAIIKRLIKDALPHRANWLYKLTLKLIHFEDDIYSSRRMRLIIMQVFLQICCISWQNVGSCRPVLTKGKGKRHKTLSCLLIESDHLGPKLSLVNGVSFSKIRGAERKLVEVKRNVQVPQMIGTCKKVKNDSILLGKNNNQTAVINITRQRML